GTKFAETQRATVTSLFFLCRMGRRPAFALPQVAARGVCLRGAGAVALDLHHVRLGDEVIHVDVERGGGKALDQLRQSVCLEERGVGAAAGVDGGVLRGGTDVVELDVDLGLVAGKACEGDGAGLARVTDDAHAVGQREARVDVRRGRVRLLGPAGGRTRSAGAAAARALVRLIFAGRRDGRRCNHRVAA